MVLCMTAGFIQVGFQQGFHSVSVGLASAGKGMNE